MTHHSSATLREETSTADDELLPRDRESTLSGAPTLREEKSHSGNSSLEPHGIDASLKRRARLLITNSSIPRQTRSLIRYALEINDPHLAQVVHRVESGEMIIESLYLD